MPVRSTALRGLMHGWVPSDRSITEQKVALGSGIGQEEMQGGPSPWHETKVSPRQPSDYVVGCFALLLVEFDVLLRASVHPSVRSLGRIYRPLALSPPSRLLSFLLPPLLLAKPHTPPLPLSATVRHLDLRFSRYILQRPYPVAVNLVLFFLLHQSF